MKINQIELVLIDVVGCSQPLTFEKELFKKVRNNS